MCIIQSILLYNPYHYCIKILGTPTYYLEDGTLQMNCPEKYKSSLLINPVSLGFQQILQIHDTVNFKGPDSDVKKKISTQDKLIVAAKII